MRRSDGDAQRCKGEGTILLHVLLFRVRTLAFTPLHFRLRLFFSISYNFMQVSFSPKLFRMILFVISAHAPYSVAAIVLTMNLN